MSRRLRTVRDCFNYMDMSILLFSIYVMACRSINTIQEYINNPSAHELGQFDIISTGV